MQRHAVGNALCGVPWRTNLCCLPTRGTPQRAFATGVAEQAKRTHETFVKFREWLARRDAALTDPARASAQSADAVNALPAFRDWIAEREAHAGDRT